jgi:glycosyltransferase involved in cell wall biosynthesis
MQDRPLVSILMAAYNQEKFIAEAIDSVLASTYKNFELIIVDDCSSDATLAIAQSYLDKDNRVRVYKNERNLGDYPNRNRVASYAKGKYIKYVDGDDAIYYWGLQVVVEMMERFPDAAYGLDSINQDDYKIFPYLLNPAETYYAVYVKRMGLFDKSPTSSIMKREIFEKEGGFKHVKYSGDIDMWHRLALNHSVLVMPHGIVWSRVHEGSESNNSFKDIETRNYHYLLLRREYLGHSQCQLDEASKKYFVRGIARGQVKILFKLLAKLRINKALKIKRSDPWSLPELIKAQF